MKSRGRFVGRGGFRGGRFNKNEHGSGSFGANEPPSQVIVDKVPYFNGRIFLSNKQEVGKIDEILGQINNFYCSVKLAEGFKATSFEPNSKLYIDPRQSLPMARFTNKPDDKHPKAPSKKAVKKEKFFKTSHPPASTSRGTFKASRGTSRVSRGTFKR